MTASRQQAVEGALLRAWTGKGLVSTALLPLSWLYGCLAGLQRSLYRWGLRPRHRIPAVVVVVGNVVAGGAGKTPTTIAIVRHLRAQGHDVGVVSRGYGRRSDQTLEVLATSPADSVGDEPLLIHKATGVPVVVGRDRAVAATSLLEHHPAIRVIVCDDGLQHHRLARDVEVCVFDDRGCGNGRLLPAGPLREAWPRRPLQAQDKTDGVLVLHTGNHPAFAGFTAQRALQPFAQSQDGTRIPLEQLAQQQPYIALAGIAQPESFFTMLRAAGVPLQATIPLPDHYHFDSLPISFDRGYRLICTEKDAAKLWRLAPDALSVGLMLTPEPAFFHALDERLARALAAQLSSSHGHPTT